MISGASVAAHRVFGPAATNPFPDPRAGQSGAGHSHTDKQPGSAEAVQAAKSRIQPASQTQKQTNKDATGAKTASGEVLSEEEERQVRELKQTDAKVRAHEQSHSAAGGPYASGPSYEFTTGPDGKRYAASGEVEIDSAPVRGDPDATIRKMDVVIRAALSPAEPSSQDLAVARNAQAQRSRAQSELFKQRSAEREGSDSAAPGAARAPGANDPPGSLARRIAEAAEAYSRTADRDRNAQDSALFAAALERSRVV